VPANSVVDGLELVLRGLNDSQRDDLRRVADELGIQPTDALWSVLAALQYYETLYSTVPGKIAEAVSETIEKSKQTTGLELMAIRAKIESSLIETVVETAKKVTASTFRRQLYGWIGAWVLSGAAAFGLVFGWGYMAGSSTGYNRGHSAVLDVNAAAIWSASASGQQAFRLWQAGDMQHLSACDRPGWEIKEGVCYPQSFEGKVYGWIVKK
jgi:hypothetical protein